MGLYRVFQRMRLRAKAQKEARNEPLSWLIRTHINEVKKNTSVKKIPIDHL